MNKKLGSFHSVIISNCTQYGPLVIDLLFHKFSFQERYLGLMNDSHFTFKLQGVNTSAFVGNDAVTEHVALLAVQFRRKQETFEQAIDQSNYTKSTSYKNNRKSFDKNLNIEEGSFFGESSRTTVKQKFR